MKISIKTDNNKVTLNAKEGSEEFKHVLTTAQLERIFGKGTKLDGIKSGDYEIDGDINLLKKELT